MITISCKREEANPVHKTSGHISIKQLIKLAKKYNTEKSHYSINWDHAIITSTLSDSLNYQITLPIDEQNKQLSQIVLFKFSGTTLQSTAILSVTDAISDLGISSNSQIIGKFISFEEHGFSLNKNLKQVIDKVISLKKSASGKALTISGKVKMSKPGNENSFKTRKDNITMGVNGSQDICASSFNTQYSIYYINNVCNEVDLEYHKYSMREHLYDEFRQYFNTNQLNLQINLMNNRTVISGSSSDLTTLNSGLLQILVQQFLTGFQGPQTCLPTAPYNISVVDFTTSCSDYGGPSGGSSGNNIVIVDPSIVNNTVVRCLLTKLLDTSNRGTNKLLKEFMNSSAYNVTFKVADTIPTVTGSANGSTVTTSGNNNVTIYIRTGHVSTTPIWGVAKTVMHEMAHAYLAQKLKSIGGAANLSQNLDDKDFQTLFDYYTKFVNPVTGTFNGSANSDFEHAAMASILIDDIARGIQDFVEMNTPAIKNDTYVNFDNYKALAWIGLRDTEAYGKFLEAAAQTTADQNMKINFIAVGTVNDCN